MAIDWKETITFNPQVLTGKATIRGMRISVEHILRSLSHGISEAELLREYPDLKSTDFAACQAYAADVVANERVYPVKASA
jgi:uncharacterized protein (DUF433 family)